MSTTIAEPSAIGPETEKKVAEEAQAAKDAQEEADSLKRRADATESEESRDQLLSESALREEEARGHSKEARNIASSAWQGTAAGAGIGTTLGTGTGAIVGTLVGTIATIPMAGLGALIGLPVGLIHGPFFSGSGQGRSEGQTDAPSEDEQHRAVIQALDSVERAKSQDKGE
ncbi:hypothetical protein NLU13_6627 [Sarocladium strictum]|uniref:Uncharacterized protein n=1 Tax=Sarocladium strictum TaxID=5046 RepID=A0AA39L6W6_SARSR|nr:hypothetical protein NLU13_6627 [Sarocladium strictum]